MCLWRKARKDIQAITLDTCWCLVRNLFSSDTHCSVWTDLFICRLISTFFFTAVFSTNWFKTNLDVLLWEILADHLQSFLWPRSFSDFCSKSIFECGTLEAPLEMGSEIISNILILTNRELLYYVRFWLWGL